MTRPLALALLLALLVPACSSRPTSYEGRLYYTRQEANRYRIGWIDPKGSASHPLLGDDEDARGPAPSSDGTKLAYLKGSPPRLHLRSLASDRDEQISKFEGSVSRAAWSQVGSTLAYLRYPPQGKVELVVQALGSEPKVIHTARNIGVPTWSRLGDRLYYAETDAAGVSRVYSRRANGEDPQVFMKDAADPAMSPDGRQVALVSGGQLGLVGVGDKKFRKLSDRPGASMPTWSPSGNQVAFLLNGQIWAVEANGEGLRQVGELPGPALDLCWGRGL